jgi:ATP-dependent Lon protease
MQIDNLDLISAKAFEGFIIREELLKQFRNTYPIPTYVIESILRKYCSSTNVEKNLEGLEIIKS